MKAPCFDVVKKATGLPDKDIDRIIRELGQDANRRGLLSDPSAVAAIAMERAKEHRTHRAQYERGARIEAVKLADATEKAALHKSAWDAGRSHKLGTGKDVFGAQDSIENRQLMLVKEVQTGIIKDLKEGHAGIYKRFRDDDFNRNYVLEAHGDGKTSVTGDEDAFHFAKVLDKWKEIVRAMANKEGAYIARFAAHAAAQINNPLRISRAGFETWAKEILPRLDIEQTFGGQDSMKVLKFIYNKIDDDYYTLLAHSDKGGNLADRMSSRRFLIFKSAEDQMAYNLKFGSGANDAVGAVLTGLLRRTEEVALMQKTGPNPDRFHKNFIKMLQRNEAGWAKNKQLTKGQALTLQYYQDALTGADRVPANVRAADIGSAMRAYTNWTKLGGATISSFSDLETVALRATYNGQNFFEAHGDLISAARKDPRFAEFLGSWSEDLITAMHRVSPDANLSGRAARWNNFYFKWSGLTPWTNILKGQYGISSARQIGSEMKKPFSEIPEMLRANLQRHSIGETEWGHIRSSTPFTEGGRTFLTPELIENVDTSRKMRMWVMAEAENAVPTPGIREKVFWYGGTRPGTLAGEFMRTAAQFKMFPTSVMFRVWPAAFKQGIPGVIQMAVMLTSLGYISLATQAVLSGQEPPNPLDPKTFAASLAKSGGAGYLGDLLLSDFNSYGRSLGEGVAGPLIGTMGDAFRVYSAVMRGQDAKGRAVSALIHNTPGNNLFYLRSAINYLFVYHLQEIMNPGYLRRMEKRMKAEQGTDWLLRPSSVVKRGGGFR